MQRYPLLGTTMLSSNNGQHFANSRSNDLLLTTKHFNQKIHISPYTHGRESILTLSHSNATFNGGITIQTDCNQTFNALRLNNSNSYRDASTQLLIQNDHSELSLSLTSSTYIANNILSNSANLATLQNKAGDLLLCAKNGTPSVFISSNTGYVGINTATPETWLHIQSSTPNITGHSIIEHTNPGGHGPSLVLRNTVPDPQLQGTNAIIAFQLTKDRTPFDFDGSDVSHASITAVLDRDGSDDTSIRFATLAQERVRITSNGKLGVGIRNPMAEIHIASMSNPKVASILMGNNDAIGYEIQKDGSGNLKFLRGPLQNHKAPTLTLTNSGTLGLCTQSLPSDDIHIQNALVPSRASIYLGNDDTYGFSIVKGIDGGVRFYSGPSSQRSFSTPVLTLSQMGNVGIGVSSPVTDLHIQRGQEDTQIHLGEDNALGFNIIKSKRGDLVFNPGPANTEHSGSVPFMIHGTSSNIGIRTETPIAPLHISSTGSNNPYNNGLIVIQENGSNNAIVAVQTKKKGFPIVSLSILPDFKLGGSNAITAINGFNIGMNDPPVYTQELYVVNDVISKPRGWSMGVNNDALEFRNTWDWTNGNVNMRMDVDGRSTKLQSTDTRIAPTLTLASLPYSSDGSIASLSFFGGGYIDADNKIIDSIGASICYASEHSGCLTICTASNNNNNNNEVARFTHDGRLGIGTSTPSATLGVNGDIVFGHYGTSELITEVNNDNIPILNVGINYKNEIVDPNVPGAAFQIDMRSFHTGGALFQWVVKKPGGPREGLAIMTLDDEGNLWTPEIANLKAQIAEMQVQISQLEQKLR